MCCRPTKLFTSDQVRDMIEKYHNFHKMVDFSKKYEQLIEIHYKSSGSVISRLQKLGEALPKRRKKRYAYIIPLVEAIVKQREHSISRNQQSEV